mmetsp:Transcript_29439/g.26008  ORF Transcript_29439/g.26008 Transcript_29439/m.26008 type:complete len:83 (+) Transcript_29439:257-505(+)
MKKYISRNRLQLINNNYINIRRYDQKGVPKKFNSVFLDLGFNFYQLADEERGFSYLKDGYLDMRYSPDRHDDSNTAADILNK